MTGGITNTTNTQPVAPPAGGAVQKPIQSTPQFVAKTDSVQLSAGAQAMATALQETKETPTQTAQEAGRGDSQAQRLLAKEAAQKKLVSS
jgi:hypothetical protein